MSSKTIHNIVTLTAQDDKIAHLVEAFESFSQHVETHEPDTLLYYSVQPNGKNQLIIIEKYANESALKIHVESEAFKEFSKALSGTLKSPPDIKTSTFCSGFEARPRI